MPDVDSLFVELAVARGLTSKELADDCARQAARPGGERLAVLVARRAQLAPELARRLLAEAEALARSGEASSSGDWVRPVGSGGVSASTPSATAGRGAPSASTPSATAGGGAGRATLASLRPGTVFGRFRLEEELGRGGMGVVWRARQRDLDRDVALKMLLPGAVSNERLRQRFLAEAKAVARLTHPNVVTVHEAGELSGFLYFSMDYVAGPSLAQLLKTRVLPLERALEIALGVCEGLGAAHEAGLVHRDLKPANVLLDPRGVPRITDFGIAKDTTRAGKTLPGELLGTPSYMSPEQADGRSGSVDARADLYALGAILYRVLTGSPPFTGQSNYEILQGILKGELVPPRKLVSELPPSVDALVVRCLARRPEDRFPSAAALAAALRQALAEVGGGAPVRAAPPSPAKGWGLGLVVAAAVCALGAAGGGLLYVERRRRRALEEQLRREAEIAAKSRREQARAELAAARALAEVRPREALKKARAVVRELSEDVEAQLFLARLLLEVDENPEAALGPAERALALAPRAVEALALRGRCLLALGRPAQEVEEVARRLEDTGEAKGVAAAASLRCDLALARDDASAAVGELGKALQATPDDLALRLRLAEVLLGARRFESAEEAATRVLDRAPQNARALAVRARALLEQGERVRAREDAAAAIAQDAQNALAARVLREVRERARPEEPASERPPSAEREGPRARHRRVHALLAQAQEALRRGDSGRASALLASAHALEPAPNCAAEVSQRVALLGALGRHDEARAEARRYRALRPDDPRGAEYLGAAHLAAGEAEEAERVAAAALAGAPRSGPLHYLRGEALAKLGRPEEALEAFEEAERCLPNGGEAAAHERTHLLLRLGRNAEALSVVERCLRLRPARGHYHLLRAQALAALGRRREALEALGVARDRGLSKGDGAAAERLEGGLETQ